MILALVAAGLLSTGQLAPLSLDTQTFLTTAVRERSASTPWVSLFGKPQSEGIPDMLGPAPYVPFNLCIRSHVPARGWAMRCIGSWDGSKVPEMRPFSNALAGWLTHALPDWRPSGWMFDPDSEKIMGAKDATFNLTDSTCDHATIKIRQNTPRTLQTPHGTVELLFVMASASSCAPGEPGAPGTLKPDAGAPDIPRLGAASKCIGRGDEATCLLQVEAGNSYGEGLVYDLHFVAHPEVLTGAGIDPVAIDHWLISSRPSSEPEALTSGLAGYIIGRPDYDVRKAVWNVIRLDRAGAPPNQAIRPAQDLKPPFADDGSQTLGQTRPERLRTIRLQSFAYIWDLGHDEHRAVPGVHPSDGLIRAALAAWEKELAANPIVDDPGLGPITLAKHYNAIGDRAGRDRTLKLASSDDYVAKVETLVLLSRLDDAAEIVTHPDVAAITGSILKRRETEVERNDRLAQQINNQLATVIAAARPDRFSTPESKQVLDALRRRAAVQPNLSFATTTAFKEELDTKVENARDLVVKAAVATHRYDLAASVAKVLLDDQRSSGWAADTLPVLVRFGSPDVAAREINMLEQRLVDHAPYNQVQFTSLAPLYKAWRDLRRPDQAQALLDRWMPEAKTYKVVRANGGDVSTVKLDTVSAVTYLLLQENRVAEAKALGYVSPAQLLQADIEHGRGLSKLDVYLAEAKRPADRQSLWQTCSSISVFAKRWSDAQECIEHEALLAQSSDEKSDTVGEGLTAAAKAAGAGQAQIAKTLLALSLRLMLSVPSEQRRQVFAFASQRLDPAIIQVAEAELQSQGSL